MLASLPTCPGHNRFTLGRVHGAHHHVDRRHAGHAAHAPDDVLLDLAPQRAAGDREGHADADSTGGFHLYRADHPQIDHVVAELGVHHRLQRLEHGVGLGWLPSAGREMVTVDREPCDVDGLGVTGQFYLEAPPTQSTRPVGGWFRLWARPQRARRSLA